jgi:geranylgeranyl pyrophosphate synthase
MRQDLLDIYQAEVIDDEGTRAVMEILEAVAAKAHAQALANEYLDAALKQLRGLSLRPLPRRQLHGMARFVVERDS